jgi:hypothetical protein
MSILEDHLKERKKYIECLSKEELEDSRDQLVRNTVLNLIFSLLLLIGSVAVFVALLVRV